MSELSKEMAALHNYPPDQVGSQWTTWPPHCRPERVWPASRPSPSYCVATMRTNMNQSYYHCQVASCQDHQHHNKGIDIGIPDWQDTVQASLNVTLLPCLLYIFWSFTRCNVCFNDFPMNLSPQPVTVTTMMTGLAKSLWHLATFKVYRCCNVRLFGRSLCTCRD